MAKQKFRITNWHTYNNALINRGSMTFWLDDEAIKSWYDTSPPSTREKPLRYSDLAITTVLVIKRVFRLTLQAVQGMESQKTWQRTPPYLAEVASGR